MWLVSELPIVGAPDMNLLHRIIHGGAEMPGMLAPMLNIMRNMVIGLGSYIQCLQVNYFYSFFYIFNGLHENKAH